ncbi:hypothetical protein [Vibrio sp. K4]|uniref:hypothetical protein n=1 Tax=Vibrio sp. K4 TaxID=3391579 RepID=UPI003DA77A34
MVRVHRPISNDRQTICDIVDGLSDVELLRLAYFYGVDGIFRSFGNDVQLNRLRDKIKGLIDADEYKYRSLKKKVNEKDDSLERMKGDLLWLKGDIRANAFVYFYVLSFLNGFVEHFRMRNNSSVNVYTYFSSVLDSKPISEIEYWLYLLSHFLFFEAKQSELSTRDFPSPFSSCDKLMTYLDQAKQCYSQIYKKSNYSWVDERNSEQCKWFIQHVINKYDEYSLDMRQLPELYLKEDAAIGCFYCMSRIDVHYQNLDKVELIHKKIKEKWSSQKSKLKKKERNLKPYNYTMSVDLEPKLNLLKKETGLDKEVLVEHAINAFYETYQQRRSITLPQGKKSYMYSMSYGFDGLLSEVQNKLGFEGDFGELIEAAIRYYAENYLPEVRGIMVGQVK